MHDVEQVDDEVEDVDDFGDESLDEPAEDEPADEEPDEESAEVPVTPRRGDAQAEAGGLPGLFDPDEDPDEPEVDADREWPCVLLTGKRIRGPFYRPSREDGAPMVDVYDLRRVKKRLLMGAHRGRLPYDADEDDLFRLGGEGAYYVAVRRPDGTIAAGHSVRVSRAIGARPPEAEGPAAPRTGEPTSLGDVLKALLESNRHLQDRLVATEQARAKAELQILRKAVTTRGAEGASADGVDLLERELAKAERLDQLLERRAGRKATSAPEAADEDEGFMAEVMAEFANLRSTVQDGKEIVKLLTSND
jgi:hypothetical protein